MITLTEEERAILNHVVEDADDWASRPVVTREHVDAKVAKHKQSYLDAQGDGYKTRKQHEDAFAKEEQGQHDNVTYDVKEITLQLIYKKLDKILDAIKGKEKPITQAQFNAAMKEVIELVNKKKL